MNNVQSDQKMTVEQMRGIAQDHGYVNRKEYRKATIEDKRQRRDTSKSQVPVFLIMGGGARMSGAPIFIPKRRKKKYWQKAS